MILAHPLGIVGGGIACEFCARHQPENLVEDAAMTAHGAYTTAKAPAKKIKELARMVEGNLKALFATGEQLEDDADLISELRVVGTQLREVLVMMESVGEQTAKTARAYLKGRDTRKPHVIATATDATYFDKPIPRRLRG
jgi:hypothetical protein